MKLTQSPIRANEIDGFIFTKYASVAFMLVVGLFIAARLRDLTTHNILQLAGSEIFGVQVARHDWDDIIAYAIKDIVHPPLFYVLLKLWISIGGESLLWWIRLFPVLTSIAALVPFLLLCRELKLRAAEINLTLALMAVNAYLISNSQGLRMYSLLLFFALCSLWLFVRLLNHVSDQKKTLLALFAVNLALVYTHYYGWLVVGVQFLILVLWDRRKLPLFSVSVMAIVLCFIPWAYAVTEVASEKGLRET